MVRLVGGVLLAAAFCGLAACGKKADLAFAPEVGDSRTYAVTVEERENTQIAGMTLSQEV